MNQQSNRPVCTDLGSYIKALHEGYYRYHYATRLGQLRLLFKLSMEFLAVYCLMSGLRDVQGISVTASIETVILMEGCAALFALGTYYFLGQSKGQNGTFLLFSAFSFVQTTFCLAFCGTITGIVFGDLVTLVIAVLMWRLWLSVIDMFWTWPKPIAKLQN